LAKALTAKFVEKAETNTSRQEIPDGALPGFYLIVQPSGAKSWALRYRYAGKTKKLTIGSYPRLQLGEARELARASFLMIEKGNDPAAARKGSETPADKSVEEIARRFVQQYVMHINRPKTQIERARILGLKIEPDGTLTARNNANSVMGRWGKRSVAPLPQEAKTSHDSISRPVLAYLCPQNADDARALSMPPTLNSLISPAPRGLRREPRFF